MEETLTHDDALGMIASATTPEELREAKRKIEAKLNSGLLVVADGKGLVPPSLVTSIYRLYTSRMEKICAK